MTVIRGQLGALRASLDFVNDPFSALERAPALGDLVFTRMLGWPTVLVTSPALVHEVLTGPGDLWHKDRWTRRSAPVFGQGLLLSDGEVWRRQRRMLQPGFRHGRYEAWAAVMREEAERAVASLVPGERLDLSGLMSAVTLRVAVRTLFGSDLDDKAVQEVGAAFTHISDFLATALANAPLPLPRWLPVPTLQAYHRGIEALDRVVLDVVTRRRASDVQEDDLLGLLLAARDDDGSRLDATEVRDQVMTFLLAGHETTALLLTHAVLLLGLHPAERAKVEAELAQLPDPLGFSDATPVLDRVISETFRLRPPAWAMSREATRDTELGGHAIAAGTIVIVAPWGLHHDPRSWGPDVAAFHPDRFLGPPPPKGSFLPFGAGGRKCIGSRFAEMEARLLLATFLRAFRFESEDRVLPPLSPSITARPVGPVWVRVHAREATDARLA